MAMKRKEIERLRDLINEAIAEQLPEKDKDVALAISNVITGMAVDIGRIADAIERIAEGNQVA